MPRHFPSKSDYRRYVQKRTPENHVKGCSYTSTMRNFRPSIDTEKDYFNNKYQNVVRGYQNLVVMEEFRSRSLEEWRWLYYQNTTFMSDFSKICTSLENTVISKDVDDCGTSQGSTNLAEISEPFGHNMVCSHLEPVHRDVNLNLSDSQVLHFSEDGQINSFMDYIIKG
ncbi:hypothetical protein Zmor_023407 [Zophobas morio]|uniref:Uncharacterized protein n=1 Tax=Zophobas morio TaxID=2755281 RepID=A0AA38M7D0_9CUCU|nr:hypothetical protein Zmor_023407 [Zophobas morio]